MWVSSFALARELHEVGIEWVIKIRVFEKEAVVSNLWRIILLMLLNHAKRLNGLGCGMNLYHRLDNVSHYHTSNISSTQIHHSHTKLLLYFFYFLTFSQDNAVYIFFINFNSKFYPYDWFRLPPRQISSRQVQLCK